MQKSGSLYKRSAQSSAWQQRQVTLNIDSGILKFFAEKSGNRIPKGQVCIKEGKLRLLDSADIGHQFAFEIQMDDMVGKSDDAVQTLSVDTQEQLDQWVEWVELTFATERRKSTKIGETRRPSSSENLTESFKWSVVPGVPKKPDSFKKSIVSSLFQAVESTENSPDRKPNETNELSIESTGLNSVSVDPFPDLPSPTSGSAEATVETVGIAAPHSPLKLDIEEETKNATKDTNGTVASKKSTETVPVLSAPVVPTTELVPLPLMDRPLKPLTRRPSKSSAKDLFAQNDDDASLAVSAIPPGAPEDSNSPDGKNLAAKLEAKLNARRQSFKPPNFKNLLNSNGFDLSSRKSHMGSETASETDSMAPSARTTNNGTPVPSLPPTPNLQNDPANGFGPGIAGQKNSARRSTVTPSPSLENIYVESGEVSPLLINTADSMPARRSFTKSPARRRTSKKATHIDTHISPTSAGAGESDTSRPHTPSHSLTKHLNIKSRPTDTVRSGPLYKLDTSHSHEAGAGDDMGQDVWLTQSVSLDVTTGIMLIFSEINGKKFQRAKFDINLCSVKSIDQLFHSRLYAFKITYKPEDPAEKKITAVFAAENEEILHYWLASFEDCEEHFHAKHAAAAAALVASKNASESASVSGASSPVRPSSSPPTATVSAAAPVASETAAAPAATAGVTEAPAKFDARAALAAALAKRRASKTGDITAASEPAQESAGRTATPVVLEETPPSPPATPSVPMNPLAAALQARFASAPSVFRKQETEQELPPPPPPAVSADDSSRVDQSVLGSRSTDGMGEGRGSELHLLRVNTLNMDQMLSMDLQFDSPPPLPYTPMGETPANSLPFSQNNKNTVLVTDSTAASSSTTPTQSSTSAAEAPFSAPIAASAPPALAAPLSVAPVPVSPPSVDLSAVKFSVQRVKYPADRLSRRIKIWYCSSGFSLSTAADVEHFVKELRNTDDAVLAAFSEEKFDELQDWANLLAMLRKYEQKWAITNLVDPAKRLDGIAFDVTSASRSALIKTKSTFTLKANLDISGAAKLLSKEMNASEAAMMEALPAALLSKKDDSVLSQGLGLLNDDLTLAEDIVVYQEEVIDRLWGDLMDHKALLENRDETIVKLHAKVSQLESNNHSAPSSIAKKSLSSISHPQLEPATSWEAEKNQLVKVHYEAKAKYVSEIQTLRKALTPSQEQTYKDLRKSEFLRAALEEEVVNAHIHNDTLKAEVAALKDKLYEAEGERSAMEAHWSEQIEKLKKEHEQSMKLLQKDVDRATQQALKVKEDARKAVLNGTAVVTAHPTSTAPGGSSTSVSGNNGGRGASPSPFTMVSYTTGDSPHPQASQSGAFSPASFSATQSNGLADAAKVVKIVSRFNSPTRDENNRHTNKTYVNAYSQLQDPASSSNGSSLNSSTKSNTNNNSGNTLVKAESPKVFLPYNYSSEFKEGAEDAALQQQRFDQFLHSMPSLSANHVSAGHAAQQGQQVSSSGYYPSGSVGSLRRDELVDPEDDEDEVQHFHPASSQQQPRQQQQGQQGGVRPSKSTGALSSAYTGEALAPTGTSGKHNRPPNLALQASLRSQRLPPSASNYPHNAPMTPGTRMTGPFSSAPASPANPLLVPRSAFSGNNQNPIRAAIKSDVVKQQQQPVSATSGGAYIAPHNAKYTVKPTTEDSARTRAGTPGMGSGPPSPAVGYMSATKSTIKQHQLTKDSAKDSFYKKYVYENN